MADRTRTGKAGSGASEWGPKLELAKPKSSDRKGRRSVESSYLASLGMAQHRTLGAQCMRPREVAKYLGTLGHPGTQTSSRAGHPSPVAANALPPSSSSTSCLLVLVLPLPLAWCVQCACASSTAQAAALPPFAAAREP